MRSKRHELDIPENPDEETQVRAVQQPFDLWITPEIERRTVAGSWLVGTSLSAAQILLPSPLDNKPIVIRLNGEVRVLARVELATPTPISPGDPIYERQIANIREIARSPEDDQNAGMLTLLSVRGNWHMFFDFRRDAQRAARLLDLAGDFLQSSNENFAVGRPGPAYDNLFSAAELAARAQMLLFTFFPYNNPKDHGAIASRYHTWTSLGNMPATTGKALKRLAKARVRARYLEHEEPYPDFAEAFSAVEEMLQQTRAQLPDPTRVLSG